MTEMTLIFLLWGVVSAMFLVHVLWLGGGDA